jgi:hypothetical protein
MFGSGEALKTNRGLFRRYSRWNEKRRGGSRGNLHGGRPVRWVLPYKRTLPNWFGKFGLGCSTESEETLVRDALMKRLADLVDEQNKTTGVDRQVRHVGQYTAHGTSVRDTQKATLQNVAATVNIGVLAYGFPS